MRSPIASLTFGEVYTSISPLRSTTYVSPCASRTFTLISTLSPLSMTSHFARCPVLRPAYSTMRCKPSCAPPPKLSRAGPLRVRSLPRQIVANLVRARLTLVDRGVDVGTGVLHDVFPTFVEIVGLAAQITGCVHRVVAR